MLNMQFCGIVEPIGTDSRRLFVKIYNPSVKTNNNVIYNKLQKLGIDVTFVKSDCSKIITLNDTYEHSFTGTSFGKLGKKTIIKPTKYQQELAQRLSVSNRSEIQRFLVYWNMGSGKTYGVLNALKDCESITVVCPITLITSTWLKTFKMIESTSEVPLQTIDIMGPDAAKKLIKEKSSFFKDKIVIVDEIQLLRNASMTVMKIILDGFKHARLVIGVTGTPIVNSEKEIDYLYQFFLQKMVDFSIERFRNLVKNKVHYYWNRPATMPIVEQEIIHVLMTPYQVLRYACCINQSIDVGNLAIQTRSKQSAYNTLEAQICTRVVRDTEEHCPKIDVCIERIMNNIDSGSMKQAVYCHYIESLAEPLMRKLKCSEHINVNIIQGKTPTNERKRLIDSYNSKNLQKPQVLIFTDAANLGISLKGTTHIHLLDMPQNKASYDQIVFRTARKGSHPVGSHLTAVLYISKFPKLETLDKKEMKDDFMKIYDLKSEDIHEDDLFQAIKKQLQQKQHMTVEEHRFNDMTQKDQRIQPFLNVLKNC
jgi:superfamily II DNA or RNA helicase